MQPLAMKKLSIHRPGGDLSYVMEYDIVGYGHGRLDVAAGSSSTSEVCTAYVSRVSTTTSGAAVSQSVEPQQACDGVNARAEVLPGPGGAVLFSLQVRRLDKMQTASIDGNIVQMPSISNLSMSQQIALLPGQTMIIESGGLSLTSN